MSLLKLAKVEQFVEIRGEQIAVAGISIHAIASIVSRHPDLIAAFQEGISIDAILKSGPDCVASIIAAATGDLNNLDAEEVAKSLTVSEQVKILEACISATFENDAEGFMKRIEAAANRFGVQIEAQSVKTETS